MSQIRIDTFLHKNFNLRNLVESKDITKEIIAKFRKKKIEELKKEILGIERGMKLIFYDFPNLDDKDIEFHRKYLLLLKIVNKVLEKSFDTQNFTFSWVDILTTLLHLQIQPDLMIKSMIRELKRRNSYKAKLCLRSSYDFTDYNINFKYQKRIFDFDK